MIRLPSTHAAITAPLPASSASFPGVPLGRSLLDGREFRLSPVMVDTAILPSTNLLALGGLGSGKSATSKTHVAREIRELGHQGVVIDTHGEDGATGEWRPTTKACGGQVIEAGDFTINPLSPVFTPSVREQLIRSLILAVEPDALSTQAGHALQHALAHPKSTSLSGLVDALVSPEKGTWPAATLAEWGVTAAIALSRYTEGSLSGIFDGPGATLPDTDLPLISFDFTTLDRNSPAIPSLMAAVTCWVEHVWLRQSKAVHKHLILEEAWQILLSPATAALVQRVLKNSRRSGLSVRAVMHTLSDLGEGRAADLARLCEIAHVGRLGPEEAAMVGAVLGLPQWAVDMIPTLGPGQAVWKIGPHYVDVVQTVQTEEEARLTDTSSRRRRAQQVHLTKDIIEDLEPEEQDLEPEQQDDADEYRLAPPAASSDADVWDWDMPPNIIDTRHYDVVQAAREGRFGEAAELAVIGEREDIRAHGINSAAAISWLSTRAAVADLCGSPDTAVQLRATVTRMGKDIEWWDREVDSSSAAPAEPYAPLSADPTPAPVKGTGGPSRRRTWPFVVGALAVALAIGGVWQKTQDDEREQREAAYKGKAGASLTVDSVNADLIAQWTRERDHVIVELSAAFEPNAKFLRIEGSGKTAQSYRKDDRYTKPPQLSLPVSDPLADVTVQIEIGGASWKEGSQGTVRKVRFSPTGVAYDAETGQRLPRN
ncbi:hypothetical protein [Streptomyces racemochromogenes]|uniref:hypothetical protein n=1 Tax=Streptomyces racemochromogenes TaxID=67353 RepID=UPI0035EAB9F2